MRVPLSWLRTYAPLPDPVDATEVARRLTAAGLEVESLESVGQDIRGVVVGQVLSIEELAGPLNLKKPIRYCRVAVSEAQLTGPPDEAAGVICGAVNFAVGDRVPLALPGAMLPGGFEISARKTYGRISEGMICSARELAIGEDHAGIIVLPPDAPLGADFVAYAGLRDEVFEIAVTPDRGYAVSVRGIARELASAFRVPFTDPASAGPAPEDPQQPGADAGGGDIGEAGPEVYPARIDDPSGCDRFVLREVRGFSPAAHPPLWMRVRLARCGVRSVSLAVDVTNYLMLELGQPLHAFDRSKLTGEIAVRRARPGETLETLDHVVRTLDPDDILITDAAGPISLAGTMGGLSTEIDSDSSDLVIEAAHFDADAVAKMSRRHKLHSEASYRFERGVDRELPLRATAKAVALLSALGGGRVVPGCTHASVDVPPVMISMAADYPDRVAGVVYGLDIVVRRLREVGCAVRETRTAGPPTVAPWRADEPAEPEAPEPSGPALVAALEVTPPSWRPDLTDPADLAEEVIRLEGYENVPARMPRALAGRGLTPRQRLRRSVGWTLAESGYVEVLSSPFASRSDADLLGLPPEDLRRPAVVVANPLSEDEPLMRTTLLPGLFRVLTRNIGRGFADTALFEIGLVFRPRPGAAASAPILPVDRGPSVSELALLEAALPDQPLRVGAVLTGARELDGWWGPGRRSSWADAIEAAREVGRICRVSLDVRADACAPWHPGRCAAIYARVAPGDGGQRREWLAGHAGELHPGVIQKFGLPKRTCAMELDLSVVFTAAGEEGAVQAPQLSGYPLATQDVALIVDAAVPAADVAAALVAGAPEDLLEDVRLFDVYAGAQVGEDRKSLAYTLRFRAPDRTLTVAETTAARDAAVAEAERRVGAVLRSG
jgi:phenylalanyl-tRNA synthetase beta chain